MPELPEVEVVRRGLDQYLPQAAIAAVAVHHPRVLRRYPGTAASFISQLQGQTLGRVQRRGKFLWVPLPDQADELALVAHLGMSGQLVLVSPSTASDEVNRRHLRAEFILTDRHRHLHFVDQRTFGWLKVSPVVTAADGRAVPNPVINIAADPLEAEFDARKVTYRMQASTRNIKTLLLDQRLVSGIGNIYADEALWRAGLHWATPAAQLEVEQILLVLDEATAVMTTALAQGGTSFDALYVNVNGESGQLNIALKRVEVSRRQVISQSDLVRQALTKRLESPTCSAAHRRSFGSRSLRGASHA